MASIINAATSGGLVTTADTSGVLQLQTAGTTAVTVDASQNVGINATPVNARKLTVSSAGQSDLSVVAGSSDYGQLLFGYVGADNKGIVAYNNSDNSMQFYTNNTERARFNSTGALVLAGGTTSADGKGITFPASMSDSTNANTLDDYEEGTWTPTLGGTATYDIQVGTYTKIGRLINIRFQLRNTAIGTGSTTFITGLPYNATSGGNGVVGYATGIASNFYSIVSHIDNATQIAFNTTNSLGSGINYQATVFATNTYVLGTALYI
jgi:hypothetical protein